MKRILSFLLVSTLIFSLSACGKKNVSSSTNENVKNSTISMYDYCPSLDNFIELMNEEHIPVLGYEEDKSMASWYTKEDLSEYVIVNYTREKVINSVQVDNNYEPLLLFLRFLPSAITSKNELDENFSSTKTTSNEVVNGEVVYTDKYAFSTEGIDYFKIVKRTPSKTLTQTIYVECNDIAINPLDYRDLKPNLLAEEFYKYAQDELKQKNYDSAIYYFECADTYKDSKSLMKECAYNIADSYYEKGEFVKAGTYSKIADDYSGSKELLQKVTEKLYPEAVSQLNEYADGGDVALLNEALEKLNICEETYEETKRYLQIAEDAQNSSSDLLEDELGKKIVQNHLVLDFLWGKNFTTIELDNWEGKYVMTSGTVTYFDDLGELTIWVDFPYYDDICSSHEKTNDKYAVPYKISDYSIKNGVFAYNGSNKFKIEIVSEDEIIFHSYITNKKYTLYREDSEYVENLLKEDNEW